MNFTKDESILKLLAILELDQRDWSIVDYWEADLCAIGIASNQKLGRLVYISTFNKKPGQYDYECEVLRELDAESYETVRSGTNVDINELLAIMEKHLSS